MRPVKKIVIIGVGFMGASLALAVKKHFSAFRVWGYARNDRSLRRLKKLGVVDKVEKDLKLLLEGAAMAVLALPVEMNIAYLKKISPYLEKGTIVFDLGSSKALIEKESLKFLPRHSYFVGCHPLCGSEKSGASFADPDLYKGEVCVITSSPKSQPARQIKKFWEGLGSRVVFTKSSFHDKALSRVSHLPHVISFALTDYVPSGFIGFSSGSFRELTRISASPPHIWAEIFLSNRKNILSDIKAFSKTMEKFYKLIAEGDKEKIFRLIKKLNSKHKQVL